MPLGNSDLPHWVRLTGCELAERGSSFRYLGVKTGVAVSEAECVNEAIQKVEWADMIRRMIQIKIRIGPNKVERSCWEPEDALLLLSAFRFPEALTVDKLFRCWFFFKKKLQLPSNFICPEGLHVKSLKILWQLSGNEISGMFPWVEGEMKSRKLTRVGEFVANKHQMMNEGRGLEQIPGMEISDCNIAAFNWLSNLRTGPGTLKEISGWTWGQIGQCLPGWRQPNAIWSKLIWEKTPTFKGLSSRWGVPVDTEEWRLRWNRLWGEGSLLKHKLWFWRILNRGFPTLSRAKHWGVSDGVCQLCTEEVETVNHLFWDCRKLRDHVEWIALSIGTDDRHQTLLQIVDSALLSHKSNPAMLVLLYMFLNAVWKNRNSFVFEQTLVSIKPLGIVQMAEGIVRGILRKRHESSRLPAQLKASECFGKARDAFSMLSDRRRNMELILQGIEPDYDWREDPGRLSDSNSQEQTSSSSSSSDDIQSD
ncbi:hypothetical protein R1sor_012757 [Riccia sorocarpa]|uniref:Reverse transcriptase zinc-binding domain-containing protein n=1 Tax=Riccia sorocarpa TaxID=122646 RepID=A0ABD3I8S2_9MARC